MNSRAAFWFTTATHKRRVHVHVTSHPDPRGAVYDVQFLESIPPDLPIHECIHRSICVCNRTHPVTQAIVDDIALTARFVSVCLSWLLYLILSRLHSATLKLNLRKCHFLLQILFSSAQGRRCISQFPGLHHVLSPMNFVPHFAQTAAPLHARTSTRAKFHWSPACAAAFCLLKDRLTTAPVLGYPDFSPSAKPFVLDTEASACDMGAILS